MPVVTSIAVRRGGTEDLLRRIDELAAARPPQTGDSDWQPPTPRDLRAAQREADRVIAAPSASRAGPTPGPARVDAVLLHPVAGCSILLLILFVMFQAVFAWASPLMDLIAAAFDWLGVLAHDALPDGCCRASSRTA